MLMEQRRRQGGSGFRSKSGNLIINTRPILQYGGNLYACIPSGMYEVDRSLIYSPLPLWFVPTLPYKLIARKT